MIRQYYTLLHLAKELDTTLKGAVITECFTQDKNILILKCELVNGKDISEHYIECSLDGEYSAMYMRGNFSKAKHNVQDKFKLIIGERIGKIECVQNDRIIRVHCQYITLHFLMFTGVSANILCTNKADVLLEVFRPSRHYTIGDEHSYSTKTHLEFHNVGDDITVHKLLTASAFLFSNEYAESIIESCGLSGTAYYTALNTEQQRLVFQRALELRDELVNTHNYYVLSDTQGQLFLSLTDKIQGKLHATEHSISSAIRTVLIYRLQQRKIEHIRSAILDKSRREIHRLQKALLNMSNDSLALKKADEHKLWAEILLSQVDVHTNGIESFSTQDWDGNEISIPLNPALNLAKNAEHYFDKVRRANQSAKIRAERKPLYEKKILDYQTVIEQAEALSDAKQLQALYSSILPNQPKGLLLPNKQQLSKKPMKNNQEINNQNATQFRTFELEEGFVVYVGKNAENNDRLTMKFAKQNDIWLHARGVGGSHAILRSTQGIKPTKKYIEQAAQISAYYSQSRNAKYTPVVYTERKYVRKPKGANVGAVVLERETVIMVEPKLPAGSVEN